MKKFLILTLALTVLLCGCGKEEVPETTAAPTTEATTAPTTEPTTIPTTEPEPVYVNPLTGVEVEEPFDRRIFGFTIGNTKEALPHYGVSKADILFESFVNGLTTRRFAMFSDVRDVAAIGGVRSMRIQWTDLCLGYDAIAVHAAGSGYVMGDMKDSGVDNIYAEQWDADFHYRDKDRMRGGTSREHTLYVRGADIVPYAESQGIRVTQDPERDYGMQFSQEPSSKTGEKADKVTITFMLYNRKKPTIMTYDPVSGCYGMNQYDVDTVDGIYDNVPELFKNVFALRFPYHSEFNVYHVAETVGQGEGYFACGGRIIPILWHRETNESPFSFTLTDGTPLEQGIGNSYIAMIPTDSTVEWEDLGLPERMDAPATEPAEEASETEVTEETLEAAAMETEASAVETEEAPVETEASAMETEAASQPETTAPKKEKTTEPEETFDQGDVQVDD